MRSRVTAGRWWFVLVGGAVLVAVVAVVAAVAWPVRDAPEPADPLASVGQRLLAQRTAGDLAGDGGYRARLLAAWERSYGPDRRGAAATRLVGRGVVEHRQGRPHVAWAGRTPAGPAAVVVQATKVPGGAALGRVDAQQGTGVLIGFFGPGAGGAPELVGEDFFGTGVLPGGDSTACLVGPDLSTMVVLDTGQREQYSEARTYTATGVGRTDWRPLAFRHGAAVVTVPPQAGRYGVAVRRDDGSAVAFGNGNRVPDAALTAAAARDLPWGDGRPAWFPLAGAGSWPAGDGRAAHAEELAAAVPVTPDVRAGALGPASAAGDGQWFAYGRTAAGDDLLVFERRLGLDPPHVVAVLRDPTGHTTVVYGGTPSPTAPLPVRVRLPGDQGWVAAARGAALRYRTGTAGWQQAGTDAALLPATATQVEVGGHPADLG